MQKDPMIGKTISHYEIIDYLGGGGMGVVYKAEDTKLKRTVALKFLPLEFTRNPEAKTRFMKEAQAASALDHPRIGTIYEVNETDAGHMYIAMAFYEGETLKDVLRRRPIPLKRVFELILQIANGLASAHEKEITHRDIKPANIIITEDGFVKIVDFGLAKLGDSTKITKSGMAMGTPAYMSPEQVKGIEVDHRSDIWSLGIILYELLTRQLPFRGDNEMTMLYNIVNEEPAPIAKFNPDIPPAIEKIIQRSIAKDVSLRYASINEFIEEVRQAESGKPVALAEEKATIVVDPDKMKTMVKPAPARKRPVAKPRSSGKGKRVAAGVLFIALVVLGIANLSKIKALLMNEPESGYLQITSVPPNATISVNKEQYEKPTPALLGPLEAGTYEISLSATGFESWSKSVTISENDTISKTAQLMAVKPEMVDGAITSTPEDTPDFVVSNETVRKPPAVIPKKTNKTKMLAGSLSIDSEPRGALIYLNGKSTNKKTPNRFTNMKAGTYNIRLTLDGYQNKTQKKTLRASTETKTKIQLKEAAPGFLFVQAFILGNGSKRRDATKIDVYIDGVNVGTGWTKYDLKSGVHLIRAVKPGYSLKSGEQEVRILSGQTKNIELIFEKK